MRKIALNVETTGLDLSEGHRIIAIGGVEIVDNRLTGRCYDQYFDPGREIDPMASAVHGITRHMLKGKPRFGDVLSEFLGFVRGSELLIHNAPFDVAYLDHELMRAYGNKHAPRIENCCTINDTLMLARRLHPGRKNDIDSLCQRYGIETPPHTNRSALSDARALAQVCLAIWSRHQEPIHA